LLLNTVYGVTHSALAAMRRPNLYDVSVIYMYICVSGRGGDVAYFTTQTNTNKHL